MKTSVACLLMVLLGCALDEAPAPGEIVGTRVTESALAAGCRVDCPKCPPNKICPMVKCAIVCPGGGTACGPTVCKKGQVCCNESCGTCTDPGGVCTQEVCAPTGTCTQTALCVIGYTWSSKACACVPNKKPAPGACTTDADCRLFADYCTGCDCRSLAMTDPDPTCSGPGVRCFADPCVAHIAVCQAGTCTLQ